MPGDTDDGTGPKPHLLDTQSLLWFIVDSPKLSRNARQAAADSATVLYASHTSAWEVGIKYHKGNLPLPEPPEPYLARQLAENRIRFVPITLPTIFLAASLPRHHGDPFDRLIVAQALRGDMPLISSDKQLDAYGVQRIW